mmetsp:Transcript_49781/g.113076  ORF Transcript_49781/g.113076 Transcript_49781/m.113076 type:complete len:207 (+) Transcript_49781:327-947(+)
MPLSLKIRPRVLLGPTPDLLSPLPLFDFCNVTNFPTDDTWEAREKRPRLRETAWLWGIEESAEEEDEGEEMRPVSSEPAAVAQPMEQGPNWQPGTGATPAEGIDAAASKRQRLVRFAGNAEAGQSVSERPLAPRSLRSRGPVRTTTTRAGRWGAYSPAKSKLEPPPCKRWCPAPFLENTAHSARPEATPDTGAIQAMAPQIGDAGR